MAMIVENPKERVVQETLEAVTWPGELLLGFTICRHNPGELIDRTYYLGLTQRRILLVRKDQPDRVYSIYRPTIDSVDYQNAGPFRWPGLAIHVAGDALQLETAQPWDQHAMQIAEKHRTWDIEAPYLTADQFMDSIADLADLGLLKPAQALLRKHMAEDPVLEIEPRAEELDFQITQRRWSLWLAIIMLGIALGYMIGLVGYGAAWSGGGLLPVILLFLAGERLVRRQQTWRGLALGFALLAAVINLSYSGVRGSLLDGVAWTAFGAACILSLTGKTNRKRNLAATAVFALGFLTPLVIVGIFLVAKPPVTFSDDFSTNKGWIARDTGTLTSGIEDEQYAVHVKEKNETFFAFPPANITPTTVQFDAQVLEQFHGKVGTFGVTCGYRDDGAIYLVEIDPAGNHYSFLRQDGELSTPLSEGYWKLIAGTQVGGLMPPHNGTTRVEVRCAGEEMTLTVNGVPQGQARVGYSAFPGQVGAAGTSGMAGLETAGLAPLEAPVGKMGLFVRTWPETGPEGYKVLFDNVVFQNGKGK